jgi:hypothetical protein
MDVIRCCNVYVFMMLQVREFKGKTFIDIREW